MLICVFGNRLEAMPSIGNVRRSASSGGSLTVPVLQARSKRGYRRLPGDCHRLPRDCQNLPPSAITCHALSDLNDDFRDPAPGRSGVVCREEETKVRPGFRLWRTLSAGRSGMRPVVGREKWSRSTRGPVTVCHIASDQRISGESESIEMRTAIEKSQKLEWKTRRQEETCGRAFRRGRRPAPNGGTCAEWDLRRTGKLK